MRKRERVIEHIYRSIQVGVLAQGDYLPSVRALAKQLGLSTSPVYEAYARLEERGIVESVERVGHRVIDISIIPPSQGYDVPPAAFDELLFNYSYLSNRFGDIVPLGSIVPSGEYFPNAELAACLSRSARKFQNEFNTYGFAYNKLRSYCHIENVTVRYIFRVHGLSVSGDEICQTNGASEASLFALRALTKPGDLVAVESPGVLSDYINIRRLHLQPLEIRTTFPDGLDLDELEGRLRIGARPRCLLVTPNFQNPTGALMPERARERLLALSRQYRFVLIENDTLGALRFGERLPSLKEQDPDEVIYVSGCSKTFAPGYRVGWAAGGSHSFNIRALHMLESMEDSLAGHLAVMEYIRTGRYVSVIRNLREIYLENKELMTDRIRARFPAGTEISAPQGGQYLWITLPGGVSAEKIYYAAREQNILLAPGNLFSERLRHDANLRFCFAMPITEQVTDALDLVGNIAKAELRSTQPRRK
jgi:DNA-binding transcriptional MocR family regulator